MLILFELLIYFLHITATFKMNNEFREKLTDEERNSLCCAKHKKCCQHPSQPPNIEIRAILTRCPNIPCSDSGMNKNMQKSSIQEHGIRNFQNFDDDEPLVQNEVVKCYKKLLVTMKITNDGPTNLKNEFVVIDHVYDPVTEKRTRLLNPYVIKIKQESITQLYGLKKQHVVNSKAKEVVYNKHDNNYTGCDTSTKKPTCGAVKYQGKIIPYSTGFCCSCDAIKNAKRQPLTSYQNDAPITMYNDPSYLLDGVECPRNMKAADERLKYEDIKTNQKQVENDFNRLDYGGNKNSELLFPDNQPDGKKMFYKRDPTRDVYEDGSLTKNYFVQIFSTPKTKVSDSNAINFEYNVAQNRLKNPKYIDDKWEKQKIRFSKLLDNAPGSYNLERETVSESILNIPNKIWKKYNSYNYNVDNYIKTLNNFVNNKKSLLTNELGSLEKVVEGTRKNNFENSKQLRNIFIQFLISFCVSVIFDLDKRQVLSSGSQRRGGQNCANRYTPPKLNSETYHESTHCLKFSGLWYNVYQLKEPIIYHTMLIQIFEKQEDESGNTRWRDLTRGKIVRIGTFNEHYADNLPTISIHYKSNKIKGNEDKFAMNYKMARLLTPETTENYDTDEHPELKGGPSEYLVVNPNQISFEGDQCDVAGVGFEAFYKQPNRCMVPRGTCLGNQPKDLWRHDHEAEKLGKKGCFFLKHYGSIQKIPIRNNISGQNKFLALDYTSKQSSTLEFEIKADFNTVLKGQSTAKITEVYIDSTSPSQTNLVIKVTNSGLTSSEFYVRISDCPLEMPASFNNIKSKTVLIAPQHQHIYNLEIKCFLPNERFYCSVEAFTYKNEMVALRRIRIQKYDRCICTWHCLCACLGSVEGLKCRPMSLEHYNAAGFQGALPIITTVVEYTFLEDMISLVFYILVFFLLVLLILGLTKAIIGCCCCAPVGMWGLDALIDLPKKIRKYYEYEIRNREIVYDEEGWPIHPDTKRRVRNISLPTEFCLNLIFFYTYPLAIFCLLIRRLCCPYYVYEYKDCYYCHSKTTISAWNGVKPRKSNTSSNSQENSTRNQTEGTNDGIIEWEDNSFLLGVVDGSSSQMKDTQASDDEAELVVINENELNRSSSSLRSRKT